jgi:hypothetical protein
MSSLPNELCFTGWEQLNYLVRARHMSIQKAIKLMIANDQDMDFLLDLIKIYKIEYNHHKPIY